MSILLPLLVSLLGLAIYYIAKDGKHQAIGKDMFWVGLLCFLLTAAPKIVSFFGMK